MESKAEEIRQTLKLLEKIPENRKIFFNTGVISIEITKKEAEKLLKDKLRAIEDTQQHNKKGE